MTSLLLVPLIAQGLVPLGLVAWVAAGRHASRATWLLAAALAALWLAAIALAGLWLALPWYLPLVYGALLLAALLRSAGRARRLPAWPSGGGSAARAVVLGALVLAAGAVVARALAGRRLPGPAIELAAPLRGGTYLVANGGSTGLVSAHVTTLASEPRFRPWRGQSYAVDLVRLGRGGLRARGPAPRDPAAYAIFGDTIYAPCAGRVAAAVDGLADLPVPEADRAHMAGNHVLLECGTEVRVLLAHMRRGSVRVRPGERVAVGRPLGTVGNTGNTNEPHLHVHAQRPGTAAEPLGGEPLPVRLAGRYLVRGQRVAW